MNDAFGDLIHRAKVKLFVVTSLILKGCSQQIIYNIKSLPKTCRPTATSIDLLSAGAPPAS